MPSAEIAGELCLARLYGTEATDRSVAKQSYTVVPSAPNSNPGRETRALWLELAPLRRIPPYGMRYAAFCNQILCGLP
jgi:hypothetical protein